MTEQQYGDLPDDNPEVPDLGSEDVFGDLVKAMQNRPDEDTRTYVTQPGNGIEAVMALPTDWDQVRGWYKGATRRKDGRNVFDPLKMAHIVLSNQCRGIKYKGQTVKIDGTTVTFASPGLWEAMSNPEKMIEIRSTEQMIKFLYGTDGFILNGQRAVMDDAGFGDTDMGGEGADF